MKAFDVYIGGRYYDTVYYSMHCVLRQIQVNASFQVGTVSFVLSFREF